MPCDENKNIAKFMHDNRVKDGEFFAFQDRLYMRNDRTVEGFSDCNTHDELRILSKVLNDYYKVE